MKKISSWRFYKAKKKIIDFLQGSIVNQYHSMWSYCEDVTRLNEGNIVVVECDASHEGNPYFQRIYLCYAACKKGFKKDCKSFIGLNGCHIKGTNSGKLLNAIGVDTNNHMYPIACGAVEVESYETWYWFLEKLIGDVEIVNTHG